MFGRCPEPCGREAVLLVPPCGREAVLLCPPCEGLERLPVCPPWLEPWEEFVLLRLSWPLGLWEPLLLFEFGLLFIPTCFSCCIFVCTGLPDELLLFGVFTPPAGLLLSTGLSLRTAEVATGFASLPCFEAAVDFISLKNCSTLPTEPFSMTLI
ncbi:hypothetical protein D3C76_1120230 [compost metagenome]